MAKIKEITETNNCSDPLPKLKNFWKKVQIIDDEKSCWEWTGAKTKDGYGKIGIARDGVTRNLRAHRVSFEYINGSIPPENCICHHCDNPSCVRPDHLFLGTVWDNNHDKEKKNRDSRGERNGQAKLTEEDVRIIREMYHKGHTQENIAEIFNVGQTCISKVVRKTRWIHVGQEDMYSGRKDKGL